jgi:hypothetical protein
MITYHVFGGFGLRKVGNFTGSAFGNRVYLAREAAVERAKRKSANEGSAFIVEQEGCNFAILASFYDGRINNQEG